MVKERIEAVDCFVLKLEHTEGYLGPTGPTSATQSASGGPDGFAVPVGPGLGIEVDVSTVTALAEES